jgi:DNA repair photolyase
MSRQEILPFVPTLPLPGRPDSADPENPAITPWLRRAFLRREPVALGTEGADPYSAAPGQGAFIRSLLQALLQVEGLEISITTRSPRVLQDLSLLSELDQRHTVQVDVPIPAVDAGLAQQIEPREPAPEARLWAVSQLSAEGIATRVLVKPLLPGINDGDEELRALFQAAREAGAGDVVLGPVPAARAQLTFWPGRRKAGSARDSLSGLFRRLRLEHGFPRVSPGRG